MKEIFSIKRNIKKLKRGARFATCFFSIDEMRDAVPVNENTLVSVDSIIPEIVIRSPKFAGWSAVIATHSDIVAEGGEPYSILISASAPDMKNLKKILNGVKSGAELVGVEVKGGHTLTSAPSAITAVMIGRYVRTQEKSLNEGDRIGLVVKLDGKRGTPLFPSWNCFYRVHPSEAKKMRDVFLSLHRNSIIGYAKDISSGGILGTCAIALESERLGGEISLNSIPRPAHISLTYWLSAFHSFGFVVFYKGERRDIIKKMCEKANLTFAEIGEVKSGRKVTLRVDGKSITFFDFEREVILR